MCGGSGTGTGARRELAMIRLTGSGPEVVKDDGWAELQEGFERRHCVLLEDFLERRVAARLRQVLPRTQGPGFHTREHRARRSGVLLARELELDECAPASVLLFLLLNQPRLFAALGELAGGDEAIRRFDGRCYMMRPGAEHFHVWHNDCVDGRQLGLSINLSPEPFAGGEFELRDAGAGGLPHTIVPGRFGDATLFRIAPSLEHRVRRVRGTVPKVAYAGWFTGHSDYRDVLRTFMEGLQPARAGRKGEVALRVSGIAARSSPR